MSTRKARRSSCTFFPTAAAAEESGYRPCLRCRPELAPTTSPYEERFARAASILTDIQAGGLNGERGLDQLAAHHGMSVRQLRRVTQEATGTSPVRLAQTSRLLLAKQLLTETKLPITQVAFASGFSSLRRFNESFSASYRMPPSRFRNGARSTLGESTLRESTVELLLSYRPPLLWGRLLEFLGARAIQGIEAVTEKAYRRTVALAQHRGWVSIEPVEKGHGLRVQLSSSLTPVLQPLLATLRHLFDLHARPDLVEGQLARSSFLAPLVVDQPGLRVPGAHDGFELAWRATLGQQVTVKGATTLAGRFADRFGRAFETPYPGLTLLTPAPRRVARATTDQVMALGLPRKRAACLVALARLCAREPRLLIPGSPPDIARERLLALPGIGPWTAEYICMRALHWPDAFPDQDLILRRELESSSVRNVRDETDSWRPWRSYAAMHLWMQRRDA